MSRYTVLFISGLVASVLAWTNPAQAGVISIQTELTPSFDGKTWAMEAKVSNQGDEAAHDVVLIADVNGIVIKGPVREVLGAKESFTFQLSKELVLPSIGEYRVIATVEYYDANHYPFSAIALAPFVFTESRHSTLEASLSSVQLSDAGVLELKIKNTGVKARTVFPRLILPKEFSVSENPRPVEMAANAEEVLKFSIENVSAHPGSSYPVYTLLGYDEDGFHFSHAVTGNVTVVDDIGFVRSHRSMLIALSVGLGLCFLSINFVAGLRVRLSRAS